jgi:triacylglycerol lipase
VIALTLLAGLTPALATDGFDPAADPVRYTGTETFTQDASIKLWAAIERLEDEDRILFTQEDFNEGISWPVEADYAPWIDDCFGTRTPHSSAALLHIGVHEAAAGGTPILMVHGAGDNGSRSYITMATRLDESGRPVYALTFAHPHGDVFMQAEQIANAIARIRARTGAAEVDLVSHSKGGIAAAVYLAHSEAARWGDTPTAAAYEAVGTPYRGDVRRAVFIATPLDGIDTTWRWPNNSLVSLDADAAVSPSAWRTYYPYTTAIPAWSEDLSAQDLLSDGEGDLFPGHRQLLRRQVYDLPGSLVWLGAYALQLDWYTSYEGGYGYYSFSDGIDEAIADGGELLDHLEAQGVDPGVELFILAGSNPIMPNGDTEWISELFGESWAELIDAGMSQIGALASRLVEEGLVEASFLESDLAGLESGDLVLGEVTGPSDGLVFVSSATHAGALTARGAVVSETRVTNLSHMDMLYASPVTGELLLEAAADDPEDNAWMEGFGQRYTDEDTLGWIEEVLADDDTPDEGDDTGDTGEPGGEDTDGWIDTDGGGEGTDDGGADTDGSDDGGDDDGGVDVDGDGGSGAGGGPGGCACSPVGGAPLGGAPALMALVTLLGAARRRR